MLAWLLNLGFGASGGVPPPQVASAAVGGSLPMPPNQQPILSVPDADIAIRVSISQYLARLVQAIQKQSITTFATWTPGTVANGGFVSASVTLRGLAPPAPVYAGFTQAIPGGMILHAVCTSPDTVLISLFNFTGASQNVTAGIVQVTGRPVV